MPNDTSTDLDQTRLQARNLPSDELLRQIGDLKESAKVVPDANLRERIFVSNPASLYDFPSVGSRG